MKLIIQIFVVFHWNGCVYFYLSKFWGFPPGDDFWVFRYEKIQNPRIPHCNVHTDPTYSCLDPLSRCATNPETAEVCYASYRNFNPYPEEDNTTATYLPYFNLTQEIGLAYNTTGNNATDMESVQDYRFADKQYWKWPSFDLLKFSNLTRQYVFSFYWSALILTTIGEQVSPVTNGQFVFVIVDILIGLLIFATIVGILFLFPYPYVSPIADTKGNVGTMVTNMNAMETEFQERLDGVKQYMTYRKVGNDLQGRVIKWFGYIRSQGQSLDEEAVLESLPAKLKAEIAIQVHMATLQKVKIFQDCEPGLLVELVLKLKLQVYSPGDYICRKGDVGKEMYIVKRGSLNVVAPDGIKVFVTLKEGTVFGELSILDIPGNKNGNKRTAGVRSVGYSDLFVLSKDDLWDALKEYPEGKKALLTKGKEILVRDKLIDPNAPEEDVAEARNMEQRLENLGKVFGRIETDLDMLYTEFDRQAAKMKKRLTRLERTWTNNKEKIKRDAIFGKL